MATIAEILGSKLTRTNPTLAGAVEALASPDWRPVCRFHAGQRVDNGVCPQCQMAEQLAYVASQMQATVGPRDPARAAAAKRRATPGALWTAATWDEAQAYRQTGEKVAYITARGGGWFEVRTARTTRKVRTLAAVRAQFTKADGFIRVYHGEAL